jgi:hypothetical protein
VLYNILIEFGVPMKLVEMIKVSFNESYSKVHIDKHLSDNVRFEVFIAVTMKNAVFWDMTPCSSCKYQRF